MNHREDDMALAYFFAAWLGFAVLAIALLESGAWATKPVGEGHDVCFAFFGHCADAWTAIGTMGLFVATIVLVAVGLYQAIQIRDEARLNRTLSAADRYFYDPIVDLSQRNLRLYKEAWGKPEIYRIDIQTVLNQLDGLASGIEKRIYDESFIRDTMLSVFAYHIVMHLDHVVVKRFYLNPDNFGALLGLDVDWEQHGDYRQAKIRAREFASRLKARGEWGRSPSEQESQNG